MALTYTLDNNASGKYSLDGSTIKVAGALTAGTDNITVTATDENGWVKTKVIPITVTGLQTIAVSLTGIATSSAVLLQNNAAAPDGSTTAHRITPASNSSDHGVYRQTSITLPANGFLKVAFKQGVGSLSGSVHFNGSNNSVRVNLTTGAVLQNLSGITPVITDLTGGWWQVSLPMVAGSYSPKIMVADAAGNVVHAPNGTDYIFFANWRYEY